MDKRDWLTVGLKLIGAYFAVLGVTVLFAIGLRLSIDQIERMRAQNGGFLPVELGGSVNLLSALQPIAYLVCAFILMRRTDWCVNKIIADDRGFPVAVEPVANSKVADSGGEIGSGR